MADTLDLLDVARTSMLSEGVLRRLHELAARCAGSIVEVGPYVGGSTVAMASAGRPVISIEGGGSHDNPHLPSLDILEDLRANLRRFGVSDRVTVVPHRAHHAYPLLPPLLDEPIGLLFIDADGHLGYHLARLRPFLKPGCALVFDDYDDAAKGEAVGYFLERAISAGAVVQEAVVESTWFGRLLDPEAIPHLPYMPESGLCWFFPLTQPGDSLTGLRSTMRLFEDGLELGPAHSLHADIRAQGGGRFSHWLEGLYFSTSDNSDPNANGRTYTILTDGERRPLT